MSEVPANLRYTKEHEWISENSDGSITFGITDYAQAALGDIVYIQLPKVGDNLVSGKVCGEVESTKSVSEIFAPLTGTVIEVNEKLDSSPEIINSQPYDDGWIAKVSVLEQGDLLSPEQYSSLIGNS
jgi:glycine cleavage system H protein